jgi:hypothetical protein
MWRYPCVAILVAASLCGSSPASAQPSLRERGDRARDLGRLLDTVRRGSTAERRAAAAGVLRLSGPETALPLRKYALVSLFSSRHALDRTQRAELKAGLREVFPSKPPIPARGPVEIRHYIGDEFFRGEVAAYRREGFQVTVRGDHATARRGRLHVQIEKTDQQIFRAMNDPRVHVVIFSGHADVGGVSELGLLAGPRQRGDKLVVQLSCRGVQTMPLVGGRYSDAHLIVTRRESLPDEDKNLLLALLDGVERGESYKQIRARARKGALPISNYLFPDSIDVHRHLDLDRDGRMDFAGGRPHDRRFDVAPAHAPRHRAGQKLLSAVRFLNSTNRYYAEDTPRALFSIPEVSDKLLAGGVAPSAPAVKPGRPTPVTVMKTRQRGGEKVHEVMLNPELARLPKYKLAAGAILEMENRMTRSILGRPPTERDQLRGLLFATDYLFRIAPSYEDAEGAVKWVCKRHGFPRLGYSELEAIVRSDTKNLGTDKQLDRLERLVASHRRAEAAR